MRSSITFDSSGEISAQFLPDNTAEARLLAALDGAKVNIEVNYDGHQSYHKVIRVRLAFTETTHERSQEHKS